MWEWIESEPQAKQEVGEISSARLRVPGGWIVRTVISRYQGGAHCCQTFVADPSHEWVLTPSEHAR